MEDEMGEAFTCMGGHDKGHIADSYEHGNELSASIKGEESIDQ
jgi:hypothetical protein